MVRCVCIQVIYRLRTMAFLSVDWWSVDSLGITLPVSEHQLHFFVLRRYVPLGSGQSLFTSLFPHR